MDTPVFDCGDIARSTSTLNSVKNDTGRVAFCGPYVLSAVTGFPISRIEDVIRDYREVPDGRKPIVRGTYSDEVEVALQAFGYRMELKESFMHLGRKARPTVMGWMQKPRNTWAHYILAIHKGKEGHWILIKGVKMCDTFTEGKWTFVVDGPHRGCRIMEVFEVKRATDGLDREYDFAGRAAVVLPSATGEVHCGRDTPLPANARNTVSEPASRADVWWGT